MRLKFNEEENPTTIISDQVVEESEERREHTPVSDPASMARKSVLVRVVRGLCLVFASIGIFAGLTSAITGASLFEWLREADFKKAYSASNLAYATGVAAVRVGDLARATDSLLKLAPDGTEASELAGALFPRLLEKGDLARAAKVARFVPEKENTNVTMAASVGLALGERLGLEKGREFVNRNPDVATIRTQVLQGLFAAAASKELPALERLAEVLPVPDRMLAVETVVGAHQSAKEFPLAWQWSERLSMPKRSAVQASMLPQWAMVDVDEALRQMATIPPGAETDQARYNLAVQIMSRDHEAAVKVAEKMLPGSLKNSMATMLASRGNNARSWETTLSTVDLRNTPEEKSGGLIVLALENVAQPSRLKQILAGMTALAQKFPSLIPEHDDLIRYLAVASQSPELRQKLAVQVIDAQKKKALADDLAHGGPLEMNLVWSRGKMSIRRVNGGLSSTGSYSN